MRFLGRFLIWAVVFFLCISLVEAQSLERYKTRRLSEIAHGINRKEALDTLSDGMYDKFCLFHGNPVTVIVRNSRIEHIGYAVFLPQQRTSFPSPVYNFLERYALEKDLPLGRKWDFFQQMRMDKVSFTRGSLDLLPELYADTTLSVSIYQHDERAYTVEWRRKDEIVCSVFFPSNFELMHSSSMIENENRLQAEIRSFVAPGFRIQEPVLKDLEKVEDSFGGYYVCRGGFNGIPAMAYNRYYQCMHDSVSDSEVFIPLFTEDFPIESVSNLFSFPDFGQEYIAEVTLRKYNFKKEYFTVSLSRLVGFFLNENCIPYFGVISYERSSGFLVALVEMRNREQSYEHLMKITIDVSTIKERKGKMQIILTSYISTHNVNKLYAEDED